MFEFTSLTTLYQKFFNKKFTASINVVETVKNVMVVNTKLIIII
ncbi:hypothetical protein D349_01229 [Enterococcus faecalis UP2S-6]|nr:hypothetical protein D349_01229 [Enterococcus faecalis UP2S-6]